MMGVDAEGLILARPETFIKDIIRVGRSRRSRWTREKDVAEFISKYNLLAAAGRRREHGAARIVTVDDVVDFPSPASR